MSARDRTIGEGDDGGPANPALHQVAAYFSGELDEATTSELEERLANDPDLAESFLDWQRFSPPSPDLLATEELAAWQSEDRARLTAALASEGSSARVVPFAVPSPPRPFRPRVWKVLAAGAGLAASVAATLFVTAPVTEAYVVPESTLRGSDGPTTVALGRWPHKVRFRIDAGTLGNLTRPRASLLDSMTDELVSTTSPKPCAAALCADFWGLAPGNYRLEIADLATGQPRLVAYHPVEILAAGSPP